MIEQQATVTSESGFHARPASDFVKTAKNFKSKVEIITGNKTLDGKSIVGLLSLGLSQGAVITIRASGEDEAEAIESLVSLVEQNRA